jgi:hypothetical protein
VRRVDRAFEDLRPVARHLHLDDRDAVSGVGANAGGSNAGPHPPAPMYAHTNPPHSCVGYAVCFTLLHRPLAAGSEAISSTLPSTSTFQP